MISIVPGQYAAQQMDNNMISTSSADDECPGVLTNLHGRLAWEWSVQGPAIVRGSIDHECRPLYCPSATCCLVFRIFAEGISRERTGDIDIVRLIGNDRGEFGGRVSRSCELSIRNFGRIGLRRECGRHGAMAFLYPFLALHPDWRDWLAQSPLPMDGPAFLNASPAQSIRVLPRQSCWPPFEPSGLPSSFVDSPFSAGND
jgi:hypothetical protein